MACRKATLLLLLLWPALLLAQGRPIIKGETCGGDLEGTFPACTVASGTIDAAAVATDAIGTDELDDDANSPTAGDFVTVETGAASFTYTTPHAGTDVTADLEEEAEIAATAVTGNASSGAVLFGTGASTAAWDTTPAIDCTDCTNLPAGGAFSDTGDPIVPHTPTKDLALGTAAINTSKLSIDGDADQVQLSVQCDSTQTDSCAIMENSAGTEVINLEKDGDIKAQSIQDIDGPGTAWSISAAGVAVFSGTVTAASGTFGATDDGAVYFDPATASESEWWIGPNHDSGGDDDDPLEFRQSATPGTNVALSIAASSFQATFNGAVAVSGTLTGRLAVSTITSLPHTVTTAEANGGFLLVTAAGDVDLPDVCDSATGANILVYVRDAAETVSVAVGDTSDDIVFQGTAIGANSELDSPGNAGDFVALVCAATNIWYVIGSSGTWTDGGTVD